MFDIPSVLSDGRQREVFPLGETRTLELGKVEPELDVLPYWKLLPQDRISLWKFRVYVRKRCVHDLEFRAVILQACAEDIVFFVNLFGWVFESRPLPRHIPVQLWQDQANLLAILKKWYGRRSLYIGKSRGIGDSWAISFLYAHAMRFVQDARMAVYSKDKDSAASDDDNSNLGKIIYILDRLPWWLNHFPDGRSAIRVRKDTATVSALDMKGAIQAFPATDNKSRGMRFTSNWNDESNFWPRDAEAADNTAIHTCPNRIHLSTFKGTNSLFYQRMYREATAALRVFHWWWANPSMYAGAYTTEYGRIKVLDESYQYTPGYPFIPDGRLRSANIDALLRESGNKPSNYEELYGVEGDSSLRLFRTDTLEICNTTVRPPTREGYVRKKLDGHVEFTDQRGDKLKVWGQHTGTPRGGPYSVGADVSGGRGSSYSALCAFDLSTGEQVLEWADKHTDVVSFANLCFDVLLWLCGNKGHGHAYFTFDNGGPVGQAFAQEFLRLGYGNIMRRRYKATSIRPEGEGEYYGYRIGKDRGFAQFVELERAVRDGGSDGVVLRSDAVLSEMRLFDKEEDAKGKVKPLYPYREDGHGDRTWATALAHFQGRERRVDTDVQDSILNAVTASLTTPPADRKVLFSELFETEKTERLHSAGWRLRR